MQVLCQDACVIDCPSSFHPDRAQIQAYTDPQHQQQSVLAIATIRAGSWTLTTTQQPVMFGIVPTPESDSLTVSCPRRWRGTCQQMLSLTRLPISPHNSCISLPQQLCCNQQMRSRSVAASGKLTL